MVPSKFQYTPTGGINQVSIPCHHESHKRDAHSILVEDVGMGTVCVCVWRETGGKEGADIDACTRRPVYQPYCDG